MRLRTLSRVEPKKAARRSRHCGQPGCSRATHGSKPYCFEHVEHNPYASRILQQLEEQGYLQEKERIRAGRRHALEG